MLSPDKEIGILGILYFLSRKRWWLLLCELKYSTVTVFNIIPKMKRLSQLKS
jgi:hypothetical protein